MGVIEKKTCDILGIGVELCNVYYCIANQMIYIQRMYPEIYIDKTHLQQMYPETRVEKQSEQKNQYKYHCAFEVYANYQAKLDKKQYLKTIRIEAITTDTSIDPYVLLYSKLKEQLSDYIDCL